VLGSVGFLVGTALVVAQIRATDRAESGPELRATVVEYELHRSRRSGGGYTFTALVQVRYQVDGVGYDKRLVADQGAWSDRLESGSGPVGKTVTLRVDPGDPRNVMVPGVPLGGVGWPLAAFTLAVSVLLGLTARFAWSVWRLPG
jgi:hypothetical protein